MESAGQVECRLDSAHDLSMLLSALQLREKEQKDQRVHCEAGSRGLKFGAQSLAKDVAVLGWMRSDNFKEYSCVAETELHLKLPLAPLLSCLQIFGEKAALALRYPLGPNDELHFTLEEEGASTECRLKTMALGEAPELITSFFAPGDTLSMFRPTQAEAWHQALSEFVELDAPDVVLRISLRADATAVVLRARTAASDAEVELPRTALEEVQLAPEAGEEIAHSYLLGSVLSACLRAARDAKAVKVRFNAEGLMSSQFILRGRKDLFCEAIVSPISATGSESATQLKRKSYAMGESVGF